MDTLNEIPAFVFLILTVGLLVLAGGLGTWLWSYITNANRRRQAKTTRPSSEIGSQPTTAAGTEESDEVELLRVSRTVQGDVVVFVQGERRQHLREIKDFQQGQDTVTALQAVLAFAEGYLPAGPALQPDQSSSEPPEPLIDEETFLERLKQTDLFPAEKSKPGLLGVTLSRKAQPLTPLTTPADQINELVQSRLESSPLSRHDIQVTTGKDGGICIRVGIQRFATVEEIPDAEIRALIQGAIEEWIGQ
ncbi:MAG TPA: hypothetical protein ENF52_07235 [Chloroflexi bacterium]|nr:hypothetical protein [Chloroflexota bacterium]